MRVLLFLLMLPACSLSAAVALPVQADEPLPETLKAQDVLDRMAKAYAGCKSYRDSGVVRTVFIQGAGNRTVEKPFTTAFVRPDRFRFEYQETQGGQARRYIVWRKGTEAQTWWDIKPGVEKARSLDLALGGATGVSGGSAHTAPALLLPNEVSGWRLTKLRDPKRIEDARLDKADCFRIQGRDFGDSPTTVWIDKKTFLVRRIDSQKKFDKFRAEETTTYDPVVNEEVPDRALEFNLPKNK
jgi:outer membrane lipoprotein-sorting protein